MEIAGRNIGTSHPVFIIAEISCNHGGELHHALRLIESAKVAGADAVKFQAYTPEALVSSPESIAGSQVITWSKRETTAYRLYAQARTPYEWFPSLANECNALRIPWFSSVFDTEAVKMLEGLGCPAFKIASAEIQHVKLLRECARTGKPMIVSTGMATNEDILRAHDEITTHGCNSDDLAFLHCVSGYPTPPNEANLLRIETIRNLDGSRFLVGLSDHSTGHTVPIAAVTLGARIVEKHIKGTYARGLDKDFSLTPGMFEVMVRAIRDTEAALQWENYPVSEGPTKELRRSLFTRKAIKQGEPFTDENIDCLRSNLGLSPHFYDTLLYCTASHDIPSGVPIDAAMTIDNRDLPFKRSAC